MNPFEYVQPRSLDAAVALLSDRPDASVLAGGTNLVDLMKLGVETPAMVVDLACVLDTTIREGNDGSLLIGAGVSNSALGADLRVRRLFPAVARAVLSGASAQIRNRATVGGNLLQQPRCTYFQDVSFPCNRRRPGSGCPAVAGPMTDTALLGASSECIAVHPSDLAVALCAFDAEAVVHGPSGMRVVAVDALPRTPQKAPGEPDGLRHGEIITAIRLPPSQAAKSSTYLKVRSRASFAFALTSVASGCVHADGVVRDLRLAFGGVAPRPWRARRAEAVLVGQSPSEDLVASAIDAELDAGRATGASFKATLMRNLAMRVLRGAPA